MTILGIFAIFVYYSARRGSPPYVSIQPKDTVILRGRNGVLIDSDPGLVRRNTALSEPYYDSSSVSKGLSDTNIDDDSRSFISSTEESSYIGDTQSENAGFDETESRSTLSSSYLGSHSDDARMYTGIQRKHSN